MNKTHKELLLKQIQSLRDRGIITKSEKYINDREIHTNKEHEIYDYASSSAALVKEVLSFMREQQSSQPWFQAIKQQNLIDFEKARELDKNKGENKDKKAIRAEANQAKEIIANANKAIKIILKNYVPAKPSSSSATPKNNAAMQAEGFPARPKLDLGAIQNFDKDALKQTTTNPLEEKEPEPEDAQKYKKLRDAALVNTLYAPGTVSKPSLPPSKPHPSFINANRSSVVVKAPPGLVSAAPPAPPPGFGELPAEGTEREPAPAPVAKGTELTTPAAVEEKTEKLNGPAGLAKLVAAKAAARVVNFADPTTNASTTNASTTNASTTNAVNSAASTTNAARARTDNPIQKPVVGAKPVAPTLVGHQAALKAAVAKRAAAPAATTEEEPAAPTTRAAETAAKTPAAATKTKTIPEGLEAAIEKHAARTAAATAAANTAAPAAANKDRTLRAPAAASNVETKPTAASAYKKSSRAESRAGRIPTLRQMLQNAAQVNTETGWQTSDDYDANLLVRAASSSLSSVSSDEAQKGEKTSRRGFMSGLGIIPAAFSSMFPGSSKNTSNVEIHENPNETSAAPTTAAAPAPTTAAANNAAPPPTTATNTAAATTAAATTAAAANNAAPAPTTAAANTAAPAPTTAASTRTPGATTGANVALTLVDALRRRYPRRRDLVTNDGDAYLTDINKDATTLKHVVEVGDPTRDLKIATFTNAAPGADFSGSIDYNTKNTFHVVFETIMVCEKIKMETGKRQKISAPLVTNESQARDYLFGVWEACRSISQQGSPSLDTIKQYDVQIIDPSLQFINVIKQYLNSPDRMDSDDATREQAVKAIFRKYLLTPAPKQPAGVKPPRAVKPKNNQGMCVPKSFGEALRTRNKPKRKPKPKPLTPGSGSRV